MSAPLLVVDGDSFAHRAYHGLPKTIQPARGASELARDWGLPRLAEQLETLEAPSRS